MDYRSDIRIATTSEGYDRICRHVDKASVNRGAYPLIGTKRVPEFFEAQDGSVAFGWDWIKWYEGMYVDVTNVMSALSEIEDAGLPYEFCRVGEEYDDIEFYCRNDNEALALHVCPDTSISILS